MPRDLDHLVAADHPDRRLAQPATMTPIFFSVDLTDDLPLHVYTVVNGQARRIARFERPGDAAMAFCTDGKTLPGEIVQQLAGGQSGVNAAAVNASGGGQS